MNIRILIGKIDVATQILENLKSDLLKEREDEPILDLYELKKNITEKHISILKLLAKGYTMTEIANELNIKMRTIESIIGKLKINYQYKNTTQMIADMVKKGII